MRNSKISAKVGFLGDCTHGHSLRVDDVQYMVFQPNDPPPWWKLMLHQGTFKSGTDGTTKTISGYIGKPKGLKQILWERGMYNMQDPPKLEVQRTILGNYDYQHEETALEKLLIGLVIC